MSEIEMKENYEKSLNEALSKIRSCNVLEAKRVYENLIESLVEEPATESLIALILLTQRLLSLQNKISIGDVVSLLVHKNDLETDQQIIRLLNLKPQGEG